ncbi:hypothetical protein J5N97_007941 [Dioscorea zingiberensis]|uniref:Uncharacterized protein n=1 Tax=Dioscorea zingiberensis TaxID=325984 RepID=A0A9D5DDC3_9LILI|nr:hypothetical protein J5N97_007941 [Dioscorea zingiberensis]
MKEPPPTRMVSILAAATADGGGDNRVQQRREDGLTMMISCSFVGGDPGDGATTHQDGIHPASGDASAANSSLMAAQESETATLVKGAAWRISTYRKRIREICLSSLYDFDFSPLCISPLSFYKPERNLLIAVHDRGRESRD